MAAITMMQTWVQDDARAIAAYANAAECNKSRILNWWKQIIGTYNPAALGKWACVQSCDSTQVKTDGTDLWTDVTKVVRGTAGNPHSWAIAYNALLGIYLSIDVASTVDTTMAFIRYSKIAPTGGTTTARPTAADDTGGQSFVFDQTVAQYKTHLRLADNGSFLCFSTRAGAGTVTDWFTFLKIEGADALDQWPFILGAYGAAGGGFVFSNFGNGSASWRMRSPFGDAAGGGLIVSPAVPGASTYALADVMATGSEERGDLPRLPMVVKSTIASHINLRGWLPDLYWGPGATALNTLTPKAPDAPQFVLVGDMWVPSTVAVVL